MILCILHSIELTVELCFYVILQLQASNYIRRFRCDGSTRRRALAFGAAPASTANPCITEYGACSAPAIFLRLSLAGISY
jgi:hypothetical protein